MHIVIAGTRGIPNQYGGFEQCAQEIAPRMVAAGHRVTVFNPQSHAYREPAYRGAEIVRIGLDESRLGPAGLFASDWVALRMAPRIGADVVIVLGHTPAGLFFRPARRRSYALITNVDGMERWRSKFSRVQKRLLLAGERGAVRHSDLLVADNPGIADYLRDTYGTAAACIEYGAGVPAAIEPVGRVIPGLETGGYHLAIARLEPENNVAMIIEGARAGKPDVPLVIVGSTRTRHGRALSARYGADSGVRFLGGIFDSACLDSLRAGARGYFHGHSVGGTNPALLEAMAAGARLAIHENPFNRSVTGPEAPGFRTAADVAALVAAGPVADHGAIYQSRIRAHYNWDRVSALYLTACMQALAHWQTARA